MREEKKEKLIGIRMTEEMYEDIYRVINEKHMTPGSLGRCLFEMFLREEEVKI